MLRSLLCLAAAALLWSAAPASADGALRTLATADDGRGWEGVGRLDFGETGFCTAALVAPDIVLTAAHCVHDPATGEVIAPATVAFRAGLRFGRADASRGIRRIVVHPGYVHGPGAGDRLERVRDDLALLELDRSVRNGSVHPFRTRPDVDPGMPVEIVSYGRDRAEAPAREVGCEVLTRDADVFVLSCSVDFGSSGAPVFVSVGGEMRIVSVVSAKATWSGREVALAPVMGARLDALLAAFARPPTFAPVGKRLTVTGTVSTALR